MVMSAIVTESATAVDLQGKVRLLDLSPIKFKLMDATEGEGWTKEHADAIEVEYKNFLVLAAASPDEVATPFGDVDTFWHYHILDTMKYAEDCQHLFGRFLHHFPYFGMRGDEDRAALLAAGQATQQRYASMFGAQMQGGVTTCEGKWCCGAFSDSKNVAESLRIDERPTV
jgi:hypothetical protein